VVAPEEMKEVVDAYEDKSEPKKVQATGLHIGKEKYIVIKAEGRSLYGKKVCGCEPRAAAYALISIQTDILHPRAGKVSSL
jgi:profilin